MIRSCCGFSMMCSYYVWVNCLLRIRTGRCCIYLCSDKEKRVQRIFDKESVDTMQKARRLMDRKDWGREKYFKFWTKKDWKDEKNYDLILDTAKFSLEECSEILLKRMNE